MFPQLTCLIGAREWLASCCLFSDSSLSLSPAIHQVAPFRPRVAACAPTVGHLPSSEGRPHAHRCTLTFSCHLHPFTTHISATRRVFPQLTCLMGAREWLATPDLRDHLHFFTFRCSSSRTHPPARQQLRVGWQSPSLIRGKEPCVAARRPRYLQRFFHARNSKNEYVPGLKAREILAWVEARSARPR